jgi:predicted DNA-binding transcriptional regulator AlpA
MDSSNTFPIKGFWRIGQVLNVIPVGKSTWWLWVKQGRAPAPVKLGPRVTAWRVEDVLALIESHAKSRSE